MDLRNLKIAVCKPDHLGDLILAVPAVRRLLREGCQLTLFIAAGNFALARHLFPEAELVSLNMPYLSRNSAVDSWAAVYKTLGRLRAFDLVFFLRRDAFLTPEHFAQWTDYAFFIEDRHDKHQTKLEHDVVSQVTGTYDVDALISGERDIRFPAMPRTVTLAIGAGFPHKKWSPLAWAALGYALRDRGVEVRVFSGPGEHEESRFIARAIGLNDRYDVFVGGSDFHAFEHWIAGVDLVIAADGGSAHLCSLQKPVLSVFGPSPFRRFAPTGIFNRVVTRDLACSPCAGFEATTINACLSRECLYNLRAIDVIEAVYAAPMMPGDSVALGGETGCRLYFGLSA